MKLTDLHPMWFALPARRQMGIVFDCPCPSCTVKRTFGQDPPMAPVMRLAVPLERPLDGAEPFDLKDRNRLWKALGGQVEVVIAIPPEPGYTYVTPPKNMIVGGVRWGHSGDSFENLSLAPSIDARAAGHWHGWVTDGLVK